ncbi:unnamed protein product, partial [marine sediment metagenome]
IYKFNNYIIILMLFIVEYMYVLKVETLKRHIENKIYTCKILKSCHIYFIKNDRLFKLFIKGLITSFEPSKHLIESMGFLLNDNTCSSYYKELLNIRTPPSVLYIIKCMIFNELFLILGAFIFIIIIIKIKKKLKIENWSF